MQPNASQPTGPDEGTTGQPALDTSGLKTAISAAKADIATPAAAYNSGDNNAQACLGHGVALIQRAWRQFEDGPGALIRSVGNQLLTALNGATADISGLVAKRDNDNTLAKGHLEDGLKATIRQRLDSEEHGNAMAKVDPTPTTVAIKREPVEIRLEEATTALHEFLIRTVGFTGGVLEGIHATKFFLTVGVFGFLYALGEVMLGTDFFRAGGTRLRGIGTSLLVVLTVSAVADIAGFCLAQMIHWVQDRQNYWRHHPDGATIGGKTIHYRQMDLKVWIAGASALAILLAFTVQLLWFRQSLALTSQLVKGNQFAAWLLAAAIWVNVLVVYHVSAGYAQGLVEEYHRLKSAFDTATAAFKAWRQQIHDQEVATKEAERLAEQQRKAQADPVDTSIAEYNATITDNGLVVDDAVQQYHDSISYYQSLLTEYRDAHRLAVRGAKEVVNAIGAAIVARGKKEKFSFSPEAALATANTTIATSITKRLENPELEAAIAAFNPAVPPAVVVSQFSDLIEALETTIRRQRAEEKQKEAEKALLTPDADTV